MSRSQAQLDKPLVQSPESTLAEIYPDVRPDEHEKHTFHVDSRTGGDGYKVFLDAYGWNGMCNCRGFDFYRRPKLERGAIPSDKLRCWHIHRARSYYLDEIGRAMTKLEKTNTQTNTKQDEPF